MAIDVLIVDDDRLNRSLLKRYIEAEGYAARLAASGEEALELYAEKAPDVVLLDILMPGIDGYETARRMKKQLHDQYIPIMMLSSVDTVQGVADGLAAGADDFLSKPYSREILYSRIQAVLRTKRLFNSLASKKAQLEEMNESSQRDHMVAESVMAALIKSDLLAAPYIRYRTEPASTFNGDLLMAETTPEGVLRVMLADFSGHGLAAAIGSMPVASIFGAMTKKGLPVEQVLHVANTRLRSFLPPEMFLAVCVVELNPATETINCWNAGMPPVLIWNSAIGVKTRFASTFVPLGIVDAIAFDSPQSLSMAPQDFVLFYSDGFTEAMNAADEEFGDERMAAVLAPTPDSGKLFDRLQAEHAEFVGDRPMVDDVTFVQLCCDRYVELAPRPPVAAPLALDSRFSMELGPSVLSEVEPTKLLEQLVDQVPVLKAHTHARLVMVELFNNAVDHGLLRLDSSVKDGPNGFERYYELREAGLKGLEKGYVRAEVELRGRGAREIVIRIEDSGPGFDISRRRRWDGPQQKPHGMGITLAEELSGELKYLGDGNRVEAVFELAPAEEERKVS